MSTWKEWLKEWFGMRAATGNQTSAGTQDKKREEQAGEHPKGKYTCGNCGLSGDIVPGRLGFGQCPECRRVLCSNCYVKAMGEVFPGMMALVNQCPECKQILKPPLGA